MSALLAAHGCRQHQGDGAPTRRGRRSVLGFSVPWRTGTRVVIWTIASCGQEGTSHLTLLDERLNRAGRSCVHGGVGDPLGVVAFCERMHPRLVGALALHLGDRDTAEEVAQEALARAWERWPAVSGMASPDGWVFRVALNLAASRRRRRAAERRARARVEAWPLDKGLGPDASDALVVRQAVASLPDRQRAAVVLRYFADLPVVEVAAVLGCAEGTVKSLTSQGIEGLRRRLGASLDEEVVDA